MIDKMRASAADCAADLPDGAVEMKDGYGTAGLPVEVVDTPIEQGARDRTIVDINARAGGAAAEESHP